MNRSPCCKHTLRCRPFGLVLLLFLTVFRGTLVLADEVLTRPNVLMIVVDDMNDWVGCLGGHPDTLTPNIDRLAKRGTLFANAHTAAPVCNPSRVSVMTGQNPASTGIYANDVVWHEALPDPITIPSHFKANGYRVLGGGKVNHHMPGFNRRSDWHDYFDQIFDGPFQAALAQGSTAADFAWPEGFPLNRLKAVKSLSKPPQNAKEFDWGAIDEPDEALGDGRMIDWAIEFLKRRHDEPFFLAAGIFRPHLPFYAPAEHFAKFAKGGLMVPPTKPDDCDDLPTSGQVMAANRRGDYELVLREGRFQELLQAYLASIAYADALVGKLLDALDATGAADNTIIVFWSDHGWHFGEKQRLHKFTLWERSTRIPLIIVPPKKSASQQRVTRAVGLVDIFPTLCDLCQLPRPPRLDGQTLTPLLADPHQPWQRPALTTHGRGNHALRDDHFRYIRYADGGEELYDHRSDPNEWENVAAKPELASIKARLADWLPTRNAEPLRTKAKKKTGGSRD